MIHTEQIGFSTASLANRDLHAAIAQGRDMGFRAVELLAFDGARHSIGALSGFWFDRMSEDERRQLARAVEGFANVSTHAPFIALKLLTHNPGIREESRRQIQTAIDATAYLGGTVSTVHVNTRSYMTVRDYWQEAVDEFRRLGDHAAGRSVTVALETGYPDTVEDYAGLIEAVAHEHVGACIDVGHVRAYYSAELYGKPEGIRAHNDILMEIVRRLKDKLSVFHLHDVRESDFRDHRAPGRGIVDYPQLLRYLNEAEFAGPMAFELEEPDVEPALAESKQHIEGILDGLDEKS